MKQLTDLTVSLFLLTGFMALFSAGKPGLKDPQYVMAGSNNFILSLGFEDYSQTKDVTLVWKLNQTEMYKTKAKENKCNVDEKGSLMLRAEYLAKAGQIDRYSAEVHNGTGEQVYNLTTSIHLLAKVPKPNMTHICHEKTVVFYCNVSQKQDLVIEWSVGKDKQSSKGSRILTKPLSFTESVMCTVSNHVSESESNRGPANCPSATLLSSDNLLIVYFAAGGVGLLLLIITIVCCARACHRKKRQQMESEMRLEWSKQPAKEDQQQQQHQRKKKKKQPMKKTQHQQNGPNPHCCKSSGEPHRPRPKGTMANPSAATKQARPNPSPRPPQQETGMAVVQMGHGPPLPKPRKKKTNTPLIHP